MTFLLQLAARVMFRKNRGEVFLYTTNPPYLGVIGGLIVDPQEAPVRRPPARRVSRSSWSSNGRLKRGGLVERIWHQMNKILVSPRRADHRAVRSGEEARVRDVRRRSESAFTRSTTGRKPDELIVRPKTESKFAAKHGLIEPFTVMYSGNFGSVLPLRDDARRGRDAEGRERADGLRRRWREDGRGSPRRSRNATW